jgi:hypothetical protein
LRGPTAVRATLVNRRRKTVGKPVVIGLGTLIIIILLVAYFF